MEERAGLPILAFADALAFERWLVDQPAASRGVWLKFAKAASGIATISKPQAIDLALCHGWIDGQLDKYDGDYWLVRFTPRRPRGKWSAVNVKRADELIAEGRMRPAGLVEVDRAKADGRWDAAYAPQSSATVPDDLAAALDANSRARAFFETLTGANRYAILYRIGDAKRPETRATRIAKYVAMCAAGQTVAGVVSRRTAD